MVAVIDSGVTRTAVKQGFEEFVGDAIEITIEEFSVSRALSNGVQGPGSGLVDRLLKNSDRLHRNVIEPELESYKRRTYDQFDVILEYADSDDDITAYSAAILSAGAFEQDVRTDLPDETQQAALEALLRRHRNLGDAIEPLLSSPKEDFWEAAQAELSKEQAMELVDQHFAFTAPLRQHRNAFQISTTVNTKEVVGGVAMIVGSPSVTVEYTDEAIRALSTAETAVINQAKREIETRFGAAADANS